MGFEQTRHVVEVLSYDLGYAPWAYMNKSVNRAISQYGYDTALTAAINLQRTSSLKKWDKFSEGIFIDACEECKDPVLAERRDKIRVERAKQVKKEAEASEQWSWFMNYLKCIELKVPFPSRHFPTLPCPKDKQRLWEELKPVWKRIEDKNEEEGWLHE